MTDAVKWLRRQGVPAEAIVRPEPIAIERVLFVGKCFLPCRIGEPAFIFPIGDLDLCAWRPSSGELGTLEGVAGLLGEEQIGEDGAGTTGMPLQVWRSPLSWLRNNRIGLVVIDGRRAGHALSDIAIEGEDDAHNRELGRLRVRPPIVVSRQRVKLPDEDMVLA